MPNNDPSEESAKTPKTSEAVYDLDEISDDALHAVPVLLEVPLPEGDDDDRDPIEISEDSAPTGGRLDLSALFGEYDRGRIKPKKKPEAALNADHAAEIEVLKAALETERNSLRRAHADIINNRRKAQQERERSVQDALDRFIKQLLPIIDDFERSLDSAAQTQNFEQLVAGVEAITRNCDALLQKHGIEPVESVGNMFDPDIHEAVSIAETSEHPEDTVVEELRKGYTQDGRLIRPALVKVARSLPVESADKPATEDEAE